MKKNQDNPTPTPTFVEPFGKDAPTERHHPLPIDWLATEQGRERSRHVPPSRRLVHAHHFLVLGCVAWAVLLAGCTPRPENGKDAAERGRKFVFITNGNSPYWDAAQKGWEETGSEQKLDVQFLRNNPGDAAGQISLLDKVAADDLAGLAISIVDVSAEGLIDRLRELSQKIPVITVDSDCKPADRGLRKAFVGTNNHEAGKIAGRIAKGLLPEGGTWMGFVGTEDADNARARIEGFMEGAGEKMNRLDVMQDLHDQTKARENVRAALSREPVLMFGIYSYNAPAIAEVVSSSGKRDAVKIVTFDAEENTVKALQDGLIDATIVQNTYDMGEKSLKLLQAYSTKDEATIEQMLGGKSDLDTGVRVIVPSNSKIDDPAMQKIEEFMEYMKSKGLRST